MLCMALVYQALKLCLPSLFLCALYRSVFISSHPKNEGCVLNSLKIMSLNCGGSLEKLPKMLNFQLSKD